MACIYEISASHANIDSAKRKHLAEGNAGQILSELSGLQGKTPEADTLMTVQMAASALRRIPGIYRGADRDVYPGRCFGCRSDQYNCKF